MGTEANRIKDTKSEEARILSSETIWKGPIFALREDEIEVPGCDVPLARQYLCHPGAVGVIALTDEAMPKVALVQQYRHASRTRCWEIPAGLLDVAGEDYLHAAQRELREEADLVATKWNVLVDFFTSPGSSDESLRVFLARGISECEEPFARTEEEATMRRAWVSLDEAVQMVLRGDLHNPTACLGVLGAWAALFTKTAELRPADAPWLR